MKDVEKFYQFISTQEVGDLSPGSGGQQAMEAFDRLIQRLERTPSLPNAKEKLTVAWPENPLYFPHRAGRIWKKLLKLQQRHEVIFRVGPSGKEFVWTAVTTGIIWYNHVSVQVRCWYAYDTSHKAIKHFRNLRAQGIPPTPNNLMRKPYYLVEACSFSCITNRENDAYSAILDVLREKK